MHKSAHANLVGSAEVCAMFQINRRTLTRWVDQGRIKPIAKLPGLRGGYVFDRSTLPIKKGGRAA
jgi:hypothetical protein